MNNDDELPATDDAPDILTVEHLIAHLSEMPPDASVMISVVKYPDEFSLKTDASTSQMRWDSGTDTEQIPLTTEDVLIIDGLVYLVAELEDYDEARRKG